MNRRTKRPHRAAIVWLALLALGFIACDEDEDGTTEVADAGTQIDSGTDVGATTDAGVGTDTAGEVEGPRNYVAVATTLVFTRKEDGVSDAFNLDDRVSEAGDNRTCGHADLVSPDGEEGVDNQFSNLLPLIEAGGGAALESLVEAAIIEGDLLLTFEITEVDDPMNDDSVGIAIYRSLGSTYVGTDGLLQPWQTFDIDQEAPYTRLENVSIVDGMIEAGPFDLLLPIYVFNFEFFVNLRGAFLEIEMGEDGPVTGLVGGAVPIEDILSITENAPVGDVRDVVRAVGEGNADMMRDDEGNCQGISAAVRFTSIPAYFFDDTTRPGE